MKHQEAGKSRLLTFQQQWRLGLQSCKDAGCIFQESGCVCMHQTLLEHLICERLYWCLLKGCNDSCICQLHIACWCQPHRCSWPCLVLLPRLLEEPITSQNQQVKSELRSRKFQRSLEVLSTSRGNARQMPANCNMLTVGPRADPLLSQICLSMLSAADHSCSRLLAGYSKSGHPRVGALSVRSRCYDGR